MLLLFLVFLIVQFHALHGLSDKELLNELRELRVMVKVLQRNDEEQNMKIDKQYKEIANLRSIVTEKNEEVESVQLEVLKMKEERIQSNGDSIEVREEISQNKTTRLQLGAEYLSNDEIEIFSRKGRIIPVQNEQIAFYAYMSSSLKNVGQLHTLIFDHVVTNMGSAYQPSTGTLIAPAEGLYAFSWSLRIRVGEIHIIHLVRNGNIEAATYLHSTGSQDHDGGSTVVLQVSKGDNVYLRTAHVGNHAGIWSDSSGRSSFSGWKLY